jgi:hypothetical protein
MWHLSLLDKAIKQAFIDGIEHWRRYPVNILEGFAESLVYDGIINDIPGMDKENLILLIMKSYAPFININCRVKQGSSAWNNRKVWTVDYKQGMF